MKNLILGLISSNKLIFKVISINLFALLAFSNCFAQEKASFDFGKTEILKPLILPDNSISMSPSPNNSVISTLFDNFSLSLQSEKDTLSGTIASGFRVPVKLRKGKPFLYYKQQLRGAVTKDKDARIVIFLDLSGKTRTIEYPFGKKFDGDLFRNFPRKVKSSKNLYYSATFTIFVERRNVKSVAFIQVDSFDLTIRTTAKEKKK